MLTYVPSCSYHTTKVQTPSAEQIKNVNTATSQQEMQADGEQAVEHLRTLGKLIFTNSEFRKLLKDVGILGRDVAADAATKAANAARPSEEQLRQVDETAPSNQVRKISGFLQSYPLTDIPITNSGLAPTVKSATTPLTFPTLASPPSATKPSV